MTLLEPRAKTRWQVVRLKKVHYMFIVSGKRLLGQSLGRKSNTSSHLRGHVAAEEQRRNTGATGGFEARWDALAKEDSRAGRGKGGSMPP